MFSPRLILSLSTLHLPCLMDKWGVNGVKRDKAKRVYSRVKESIVTGSVSTIVLLEGYQMVCDIYTCKLQKGKYNRLIYFTTPLYGNALSSTLYVLNGGVKITKLAIALARITGKITKAQLQSCNFFVAALDVLIFGELVPIFSYPSNSFQILKNETKPLPSIIDDII